MPICRTASTVKWTGPALGDRRVAGYPVLRYGTLVPMVAALALLPAVPAQAIVGGGAPSAEGIGRSIITIVGSRGNFCTGALIAPKLVLTAAHCVQPGRDLQDRRDGAAKEPQLQDVRTVATSPSLQYAGNTGASRYRRRGVAAARGDPEKGKHRGARRAAASIVFGTRFTIAGIGVAIRGEGSSGGTIRAAGLVATGRPGTLQIRLVDPLTQGMRDGRRPYRRFRRPGVRGAGGGRSRHHRRRQLVDRPERQRRLRRPDRRHAAHALPRLDFTDRPTVGFWTASLAR